MKISLKALNRYIAIQESSTSRLIALFEDVGLEVKRQEPKPGGDTILTVELLANRGDHHSYLGIAHEISGRTGWTIKAPETTAVSFGTVPVPSVIEAQGCLAYTLSRYSLKGVAKGSLDSDHARMLEMAGIVAKADVVNISNLIGIEIGQPTHVFDADKVDGPIRVRASRPGESATPLFQATPVTVPENTIVIADDKNILAIAGVIGCENAKPDENTKHILFESALFDPVAVRIAARAIGAQTHASMRFERGGDPTAVTAGAERARHLLEKAGWILESAEAPRVWTHPAPRIEISLQQLNTYLGTEMSAKEVTNALSGYGFIAQSKNGTDGTYDVDVPSHRIWDVKQPCDLYEEVCRKKGYGNLPSTMPSSMPIGNSPAIAELERKKKIEEQLVGQGFYEVFIDGFYGEAQRIKMGRLDKSRAQNHVAVINSQERSSSLLKNNAVAQFLDMVKVNGNMRKGNIKAYEWTRVFIPDTKAENSLCNERRILWIGASGEAIPASWANDPARPADVYYMKGLAERVFNACSLQVDFQQVARSDRTSALPSDWMLHPARKARIVHDKNVIGVIGEIHPRLLYAWDIKDTRPVYAEIESSFLGLKPTPQTYLPPPATLPLMRDICFLMPPEMNAQKVVHSLDEALGGAGEVTIVNVYNSKVQTEGRDAVTFSLTYDHGRVKAADVNKVTEQAAEYTLKKLRNDGLTRR